MSFSRFIKNYDGDEQGAFNDPLKGVAHKEKSFDGDIEFDIPFLGIKLEDIDRSVFDWFENHYPIYIIGQNKLRRKVPVVWSSAERWAMIQLGKDMRDHNGQIILPIISIKRSDIEPIYERTVAVDQDGITNFTIYVHEYINPADNQPMFVLRTTKDNLHETTVVREAIQIQAPKITKINYDVVFWSDYIQDLNEMIEHMIEKFGNKHATYSDKNLFYGARLEGITNNSNDEEIGEDRRIFKNNFQIIVEAPIISTESIRRYQSLNLKLDVEIGEVSLNHKESEAMLKKIEWHNPYKLRR